MKWIAIILLAVLFIAGCAVDIPMLQRVGPEYLASMGFRVIGYEGFQWCIWGGKCWFLVTDPKYDNIRYSVFLIKRAGEIHLYSPGGVWDNQKQIDITGVKKED